MENLVTNIVSDRTLIEQKINKIVFVDKNDASFEIIKTKNICKFKYNDGTYLIDRCIQCFKESIKCKREYSYFYRKLIFDILTSEYYRGSTKIDKTIAELKDFKKGIFNKIDFDKVMALINELELFQKKHINNVDKKKLLSSFAINTEFPQKIEKASDLTYTPKAHDLRHKKIITIDSHIKTAYDDAISLEKTNEGYLLGIYITDVASYVGIDSRLYEHARQRGASIYTTVENNTYIPMLPIELTRDFFSLNKNDDKHVIAHFFRFSSGFDLIGHHFYKAIINVSENYTFDNIEKIRLCDTNYDTICLLSKMADKLKQGFNLDYHFVKENSINETKKKYSDNVGSNIITVSTLFLNSYIAELFDRLGYPYIYRVNKTDLNDGYNYGSRYSVQPLGHVINNGDQYGHITNPIRSFASYLNQYLETELLLGYEQTREVLIDFWSTQLPDVVDKLNLRLFLNDEYRNALEKICRV